MHMCMRQTSGRSHTLTAEPEDEKKSSHAAMHIWVQSYSFEKFFLRELKKKNTESCGQRASTALDGCRFVQSLTSCYSEISLSFMSLFCSSNSFFSCFFFCCCSVFLRKTIRATGRKKKKKKKVRSNIFKNNIQRKKSEF